MKRNNKSRKKTTTNQVVAKTAPVNSKFHFDFKHPAQKMAWAAFEQHDVIFLTGSAGTGKSFLSIAYAITEVLQRRKKKIILTRPVVESGENLGFLPGPQPLDAKLLTPNGWIMMGKVKIGDFIIGRDGKPTKVLGIYPKGKKMVYKIETTENTSTECCEDHLWLTRTFNNKKHNQEGSVKPTKEIIETLYNKNGKINHYIPRNEAVEFESKKLPLSPYVLGVILGDGYIGKKDGSIGICNTDLELIERVNNEILPIGCKLSRLKDSISYNICRINAKINKTPRKVKITNIETNEIKEFSAISVAIAETGINRSCLANRCRKKTVINNIKYEFVPLENRWTNPIKNVIYELGLQDKVALTKFIPDIYKYSSIEDRLELLRGLMDTDGTATKKGSAVFTTISKQLALDLIEIVQSLGGRAKLRIRDHRNEEFKARIDGRIIRNNYIIYEFDINLPNKFNPFYISRKRNRFKTKYMQYVGIKSIVPVCEKEVQCILVENPEHLYITDQYIVTHNTAEEKIHPYMMPLYDSIKKLVGEAGMQKEVVGASVEIAPLAYLRGRTFSDAICILDEAQNANFLQLKMFLTRFDENSKIIINGDLKQCDLRVKDVPLFDVIDRLSKVPGIAVVDFKAECVVRHPLIKQILASLEA